MVFINEYIDERGIEHCIQYNWSVEKGGWEKIDLWKEAEKKEATKARSLIEEYKAEAVKKNPAWVKETRTRCLQDQIKNLSLEITAILKDYKSAHFSKDSKLNEGIARVFLDLRDYREKQKLMNRYSHELRYLEFGNGVKNGKITEQMIQQARDYPFENLVEVNKNNFALCPFHDDHTPSLYTKGNYGYCFGACGWSGDTIKFVMKRDNISFVEAVKKLCG